MTRRRLATACALTALLAPLARFAPRGAARAQAYDLVLAGGRVLDPESGLDATRNVGVTSGRITAVTTKLPAAREPLDRKSTRLNSSHGYISYAVFCLKKKKKKKKQK